MALPKWTDKQVFDQMNSGSIWNQSVITYAFPQWASQFKPGTDEMVDLSAFFPVLEAQVPLLHLSMLLWNDLIGPTIQQGPISTADIRLGNIVDPEGYAFAFFPEDGGSVWFGADDSRVGTGWDLQAPKIGADNFITFVHEIGHALGLNHMGDYNGTEGNGPSSYQDSDLYSVMSYYGPGMNDGEGLVAWADWVSTDGKHYSAQTPMLNDIMVIQKMYGVNTTTRVDNTVYGFNSNIEGQTAQIYDFSINENPILAIYDAGGIDTLNLSGWDTNSQVDLRPGEFSSANGMTKNIAIAHNTIIENVITGAGNDTIITNGANNYIDGGEGLDTVIFSGDFADLTLEYDVFSREYTVWDDFFGINSNGTDTLLNIEMAVFDDFKGALNDLTAEVYRFYNSELGTHFYTANNDEATVVALMENFEYEGIGFGRSVNGTDAVSVQRFLNSETGEHFFTADIAETYALREAGGIWVYEGAAFNAYDSKMDGNTELFRFINNDTGAHFYTADVAEVETIMLAGNFNYEGVAFYVEA